MAARVDLNGIKEQIQTILAAANTTTATPIDLSSGLANSIRVREVLKVHPEMIRPQATIFPLVTCYIKEKSEVGSDIASSQLNMKRRSTISIEIVGSVWNNNLNTYDEDPADEDINYLMENIELILRSNSTLNNKVNWHRATGCKYYNTALDEQTHLRSGILTLEAQVWY